MFGKEDAMRIFTTFYLDHATPENWRVEEEAEVARLVIQDETDARRQCAITSPGVDWITIDTDEGYAYSVFSESLEDEEVSQALNLFTQIAEAYFSGDYEIVTVGRLFRRSLMKASVPSGVFTMQRSLVDDFRRTTRRD